MKGFIEMMHAKWEAVLATDTSSNRVKAFLLSPPERINPSVLRTTLTKLLVARVLVLSIILGMNVWQVVDNGSRPDQNYFVFWPIAFIFAVSLANAWLLKKSRALTVLGFGQLMLDICFVTFAVYLSDSLVSVSLYLLVIVGGAVTFGRHGALIIASCAGLLYGLLAAGILPGVYGGSFSSQPADILAVYLSLIAAALISGLFAKQLETVAKLAREQATELRSLTERQQSLFNDLSDGLVAVDLNGHITTINSEASKIFGFSQSDTNKIIGSDLGKLLKSANNDSVSSLFYSGELFNSAGEMLLHENGNSPTRHIAYQSKPLEDADGLLNGHLLFLRDVSHVKNIEERLELHEQVTKLMTETSERRVTDESTKQNIVVGTSRIMERVMSLVSRVAASEASVLITGESGTGKELIARSIYSQSDRSERPFVAINCGAIPENLIESELFGHKKGSFTGAVHDNPGLFRKAQGGTVFLDEIGELPLQLQTKLLRVLQDHKVRAVGDTVDYKIDLRIIAATNKDLKAEIAAKHFREDLYYRLNVVHIVVPALRDRKEDIPHLVSHFIGKYSKPDQVFPKISPEALQTLLAYPFPGNIRELENVIERALVLNPNAILPEHFPDDLKSHSYTSNSAPKSKHNNGVLQETEILELPLDLDSELSKLEKELLLRALDSSDGIKKNAAALLGLNFRSFRYRLKKYNLDSGDSDQ